MTPATVLELAKHRKHRDRLTPLLRGDWSAYPSQSEADLALAGFLAPYCRRDGELVRDVMMQSGLARPKWSRHPTYLADTITKALRNYTPSPRPTLDDVEPLPLTPPKPPIEDDCDDNFVTTDDADTADAVSTDADVVSVPVAGTAAVPATGAGVYRSSYPLIHSALLTGKEKYETEQNGTEPNSSNTTTAQNSHAQHGADQSTAENNTDNTNNASNPKKSVRCSDFPSSEIGVALESCNGRMSDLVRRGIDNAREPTEHEIAKFDGDPDLASVKKLKLSVGLELVMTAVACGFAVESDQGRALMRAASRECWLKLQGVFEIDVADWEEELERAVVRHLDRVSVDLAIGRARLLMEREGAPDGWDGYELQYFLRLVLRDLDWQVRSFAVRDGDDPEAATFEMAQGLAASIIGKSAPIYGRRALSWLEKYGYIERVNRGASHAGGSRGRSAQFRYYGADRLPVMATAAG